MHSLPNTITAMSSPRPSKASPIPPTSRSPRSPAIPYIEEPPDQQNDASEEHEAEETEEGDEDIPYPEPTSEQTLLPPPNFNPFFTIVEDAATGEHYHPFVHYVFADDDPAIITAAAMRSMGLDDTKFLPQPEGVDLQRRLGDEDGEDQEPLVESPLPPPVLGSKERYLLIDVAADGHTIEDAHSMSPDWQITNASVRAVPSFDEGAQKGHMLRIQGVEVPRKTKRKAKGQPGDTKLKEAQERSQGDIFGAMDGLISGVEGSLDLAARITARQEDVRESDRTILQRGGSLEDRRLSVIGP